MRAVRDLARLLAEQGDGQHAIELLAPIYGRFAEGFDTPDLKETKPYSMSCGREVEPALALGLFREQVQSWFCSL